jgi:undecaprenyl pyrophosphate phosphatase UppP
MYTIVIQLGPCWPSSSTSGGAGRVRAELPPRRDGDKTALTHPLTLVLGATVVTAGPAYLLDKKIGENLENLWVMGGALVVGGVVMWVVDALFTRRG